MSQFDLLGDTADGHKASESFARHVTPTGKFVLRDYQDRAAAAGVDYFMGANKPGGALMVLPTGSGKSLVIAEIASQLDRPLIVFQPTREILEQNLEKLAAFGKRASVFSASMDRKEIGNLTLATIGSVKNRMEAFSHFGYVMVDEAHLVNPKHGMYRDFVDSLGEHRRVLGLTATPYRLVTDGFGGSILKFLTRTRPRVFDWLIHVTEVGELVSRGHLAHVEYTYGDTFNFDSSMIRVNSTGADYDDDSVRRYYREIDFSNGLAGTISGILAAGSTSILVFTRFVEESRSLQASMPAGTVGVVTAETPKRERQALIRSFRDGTTPVVSNVGVLTVGFDFPALQTVVIARPTLSLALWCFDADTEILTKDGWRNGLTVRSGYVAAYRKENDTVVWEPILAHTRRPCDSSECMFSLRSRTVDIRVTSNHRMIWHPARSSVWHVSTAEELSRRSDSWFIPVAGHEAVEGVPLSDAEIAFVAWVQTDGYVDHASGAITIVQQAPEQCDHIESILTACGFKWNVSETMEPTNYGPRRFPCRRYRVSKGTPRGNDKHLTGWGHLCSWIPKADERAWKKLESLNERQWAVLLDAWHRGDGSKQTGQPWTRRSYHLATANKNVADWLQAMCVRRGWRANVAKQANLWMVHCRSMMVRSIAGTKRITSPQLSMDSIRNGEQVWCVSVASGAVIVRRNGKACIMGQSQMIGRCMRPHASKPFSRVYDLCDNYRKFGEVENLRIARSGPGQYYVHSKGVQLTNVYYSERDGLDGRPLTNDRGGSSNWRDRQRYGKLGRR